MSKITEYFKETKEKLAKQLEELKDDAEVLAAARTARAAKAAADDKHIHIDLLPRLLPEKFCTIVKLVTNALSVIVCAILVYSSWDFVTNDRLAGDMAFASIPLWWLELVFPFSFSVMTIRFAGSMISALAQCREGMKK